MPRLIPEKILLKLLDSYRKEPKRPIDLYFGDYNFSYREIQFLAKGLKDLPCENLDINCNPLGPKEGEEIANLINNHLTLTTLHLHSNNPTTEGIEFFANALKNNTSLTTLKLYGNGLTPRGIQAIGKALETNTYLKTLCFHNIRLGPVGAKAVAKALETNTSLTTLVLSCNRLGLWGTQAIAKALGSNTSVTTLDLSYYNERKRGAVVNLDLDKAVTILLNQAFATLLEKNTTLTTLTLNNNNLGLAGVPTLAQALKKNTTLKSLNLMDNNFGPEGTTHIIEALEKHNKTLALTDLNFGSNNIGLEGIKAITKFLKTNTSLKTLNLSSNALGPKEAKIVAEYLKTNASLTTLQLNYNKFGSKGIKAIAEALKENNTLITLNLFSWNKKDIGGPAGALALSNSLEKNSTLINCMLLTEYESIIKGSLQNNQTLVALKKDFKEREKQQPSLIFSNMASEKTVGKLPLELEKIKYDQFLEGLEYFSTSFESSEGEVIDPVCFPNDPIVGKQMYHREFLEKLFEQTESDIQRLKVLKNSSIVSEDTLWEELTEQQQNLLVEQNTLEKRSLECGEAQCPYTRARIKKADMEVHKQFRLFRNIFIVAARNAIYQDKIEKREIVPIIQIWNKLSPEEKTEANENLAEIRKNGISLKNKEGEPLLNEEQIEYLNTWGIGEKSNPKLELKL